MISQFLNKQGEAAIYIAKRFLALNTGDRIPNLSDMSAEAGFGAGTVQTAIKMLESEKAIRVQSRGHQGSTLEDIDRVRLWRLVDFPWISGAMPLPYTERLEGIATALYKQFENREMAFNLQYMRGGKARIKRLARGLFDFVVCSKNTAILGQKEYPDIEVLLDFGPGSYMVSSGVVFADPKETTIRDGMKIGVDVYSYDHLDLNKRLCSGKDVSFVQVKYSELFTKLATHEIDASLWNWDELQTKFGQWNIRKFNDDDRTRSADATTAVLVIRNSDTSLKLLLSEIIDRLDVLDIQDGVVKKKIIPSY